MKIDIFTSTLRPKYNGLQQRDRNRYVSHRQVFYQQVKVVPDVRQIGRLWYTDETEHR